MATKNKYIPTVQIPQDLFFKMLLYFCMGQDNLYSDIQKGVADKYTKMEQHYMYSRFKDKKLSVREREAARQEYLNSKGIPENFRWDQDSPLNNYSVE